MKKLASKFQNSDIWLKIVLVALITFLLIASWVIVDAVMFFLTITIGTVGLFILSPFVALGIVAIAIIKYPKVKDFGEYSSYTKKYL